MAETTSQSHPKGLYVLFVTEMWERFSYYGMRALFFLFMLKALMLDNAHASEIYGSYTGLVYLTPLLGGYIADKYWGNRKSIVFGGIMMAIGQFTLFTSASIYTNHSASMAIMIAGLFFLIIGNGFFKPNISTMVGHLYPKGDKRMDSAMTIFYMGINAGALIAPLICGTLGERYTGPEGSEQIIPEAFKWGFFAAGCGMIISIIFFTLMKDKYIVTPEGKAIGTKPVKLEVHDPMTTAHFETTQVLTWTAVAALLFSLFFWGVNFTVVESAMYSLAIAVPGLIISDKTLTKIERNKIWVIYILAFFVIFFWSAFEQAGASLTAFAANNLEPFFGVKIKASYFQSVNPGAIVLLAPLVTAIWATLKSRNAEPASPYKQAIGLALLSLGFLVLAMAVKGMGVSDKISVWWVVALYVIHTVGELSLSPIGLSMVIKLSPLKFSSLLMGVWFLSSATANVFAGALSALLPEAGKPGHLFLGMQINSFYDFFMIFVVMSGIASIVLFFLSKRLLKMMDGVR